MTVRNIKDYLTQDDEPVLLYKGQPMTPEQIQAVSVLLDKVLDRIDVKKDMEALEEDRNNGIY